MSIAERMAPELASEAKMTRALLARVPSDKLTWSPGAGLRSIGWNAAHLVETVGWVPGILATAEFDVAPPGSPPYTTPEPTDPRELLKTFDANVATAVASLSGVADAALDETWSLKMGGQTLFTMKKGDCLRKWVFSHTAHHRGILSAYLRLAGVTFPSIYEE